ncbi:MAG: Na+/H+ antiporter NhaC [Idiomarina sp.]|nr:Na+/H+ antiporter NhaC [Idiomarina sp.]
MSNTTKRPSYLQAATPLLALIVMLASSVYIFGADSSYGPNQIALLIAAGIATIIAFVNGYRWEEVEEGITKGISVALGAILIILMVGSLIGTWLLSGIVPTLIYFGLEILSPTWFYAASCLICAIVAISIGSSWTTAATIGVALIGVATGMELSLAITAGAVVSGAYFGDKMSPLSDTTNLAPAVSGTELFSHIRYMTLTAVPAFVIALILFTIIGFSSSSAANLDSLQVMQDELQSIFNINVFMLIPLAVLFTMAVMKKPALPTIFVGALLGGAWALIFQPDVVATLVPERAAGNWFGSIAAVWVALFDGTVVATENADLESLLSGGGMVSMLNTVWLIVSAMTFGAVMECTGLLKQLLRGMLKVIHSTGQLITATLFTCFGVNVLTADQYMAIVLPGRMFREEYANRDLDPRVLSRTLEDSGTITSALIPWNTCGAYMFAVLGVFPLTYAPFAFFLYLTPLIAMIYAFTNFKILRLSDNQDRNEAYS